MRTRSVATLLLASLSFASAATAGPVSGRVVDPSGRDVAGAVVLMVPAAGAVRSTVTDSRGAFTLAGPDTGRYEIRVAAAGFRLEPVALDGAPEPRDAGTLRREIGAVSESLVVSAAQVEVPLSQAAAGITVITAEEIARRQLHTVSDALRAVPGLTVVSTGAHGAVTGVFPRGGESDYTLVLLDGVPVNSFGGEFDFAHLSTANVERIEVVRGPQSALFGSNAIGAVVQIVTRRGGPPAASAAVEGGSFGTSRLQAATSGARGALEWGASAERLASDGANGRRTAAGDTVANDDYDRYSVAGSAGWRGARGAALRGDVRFGRDDRGFPGPFGTNPIGAYDGIDTISRGEYDRWTGSLSGVVPAGSRVRVQAQAAHNRLDGEFRSRFGLSESYSRRTSGRVQADVTVAPGLDLSAGADILDERAGSTFITGQSGSPIPVERQAAGYFAEARWAARGRVFVTAGVRVDDIRRDAVEASPDRFSPRPAMPAESVTSTNPKIAAAWRLREWGGSFTKIRVAAGTGIRPPDAFEIAFTDNPALKPERSTSLETGLDHALAGGRLLLEATGFTNEYDDLIIAVGSFAESSRYRTDNISNARARGLELSGTARSRLAGANAEVRVGYTLLDTEILAVDGGAAAPPPFAVGDPLLRRPRHQFSADLSLQAGPLAAFVRGGGRGRVLDVEPSLGSFGGLFDADGYATWSAGASWTVRRGVEVYGRVTNLFDRRYEEALGFPALGRGAVAGLRLAAGR